MIAAANNNNNNVSRKPAVMPVTMTKTVVQSKPKKIPAASAAKSKRYLFGYHK